MEAQDARSSVLVQFEPTGVWGFPAAPASCVAIGVLPLDVLPVLPDVVPLPLLFDHVGELDAVIVGFDRASLPPPSDVPMSPLPEFAHPASNASDAVARAQGIRRNA